MDSLPPSRPSTSDAPTTPQGPVPLFDAHLRVLSDSYLSFFQERKRIEEVYVESLLKLHRRIKSFDTYLDDRGELSTTRTAWNEVRDNVEREVQAREAFCETLGSDVINPLTTLKETQERTRKRIKEDLKESGLAYTDYAENMLPKLKSKYIKKCAEVEEQKRAAASTAPTSPIPTPPAGDEHYHHLSNSRSNPSVPSRPIVTGPQPLRALDRRPSGSAPPGRNRSPSSSTPFSDLAHQGKKQLNQLITFLDKGGSVKDTLSGGRDNQTLRTVRLKREAEEADREYRKGVHWQETLRLRRTKTLEAGYTSLEMFIAELSMVIKKALERYTDNMTATTATQTQLSSHLRSAVNAISSEKDVAKLRAYIPRSMASAIPEPILYQHAVVGPCSDLIFGFSLVDYATAKALQDGDIPKIVRICVQEIDQRGLEAEGIYRVSGRHAIVQTLQHNIEKDEAAFEFSQKDDTYAVASLLKLYLRELPEPVFRFPLQERIQHTEDRAEHIANNFILLRSKIRRLPLVHQATLKTLLMHLARVAALSEKNKMDAKNLAIVFGGIFGEDEMPKGGDLLSVQSWKDTVMEDLITYAHILYDDHPNHSPPLPPTPAGEPVPAATYGSKSTKITTVPPSNPISSATGPQAHPSPQDFTPRLPPRPANSIHPSSRHPQSPTRGRADIPVPLPSGLSPSEETPPPSSSPSTIYETDDAPSPAQASSRPTSPLPSGPLPSALSLDPPPQHS